MTTSKDTLSTQRAASVFVDYYITYKEGNRGRTQVTVSVDQQLNGARSETAVLAYLKKKHPEARDITIMKLEWKTTSGGGVSPTRKATQVFVDYYAEYKGTSRGRFQATINVDQQLGGAQSETALSAYLKKKHPEARDITIMKSEWK